jgi:allophanate hydrolase subunit 1
MSKGALFGFRYKKDEKLAVCHEEGDPGTLGREVAQFCVNNSLRVMRARFEKVSVMEFKSGIKDLEEYMYKTMGYVPGVPYEKESFKYKYVINLNEAKIEFWRFNYRQWKLAAELEFNDFPGVDEAVEAMKAADA